jgi:hypothetical protein
MNMPLLRRGLVDGFIPAGLQLAPSAPLRVAIVTPSISLADWQASLPADLSWDTFTWHELPNELGAEALLTQLCIPALRYPKFFYPFHGGHRASGLLG